jgi:hypothetical protein
MRTIPPGRLLQQDQEEVLMMTVVAVPADDQDNNNNDEEVRLLREAVRELHAQLQSQDDQVQSLREQLESLSTTTTTTTTNSSSLRFGEVTLGDDNNGNEDTTVETGAWKKYRYTVILPGCVVVVIIIAIVVAIVGGKDSISEIIIPTPAPTITMVPTLKARHLKTPCTCCGLHKILYGKPCGFNHTGYRVGVRVGVRSCICRHKFSVTWPELRAPAQQSKSPLCCGNARPNAGHGGRNGRLFDTATAALSAHSPCLRSNASRRAAPHQQATDLLLGGSPTRSSQLPTTAQGHGK